MGRKIITISVPDGLDSFARLRVKTGGYETVSEYFRELLRDDRRRERTRVDAARNEIVTDPRAVRRQRY